MMTEHCETNHIALVLIIPQTPYLFVLLYQHIFRRLRFNYGIVYLNTTSCIIIH